MTVVGRAAALEEAIVQQLSALRGRRGRGCRVVGFSAQRVSHAPLEIDPERPILANFVAGSPLFPMRNFSKSAFPDRSLGFDVHPVPRFFGDCFAQQANTTARHVYSDQPQNVVQRRADRAVQEWLGVDRYDRAVVARHAIIAPICCPADHW